MWKFFIEEWKAISKIPFKVISIIGISIIPIIYSITYIISFYNPFDTKDYPIGFISQDNGVKVDKEYKNYGDDIADKLKDNKKLKWKFFKSKKDADKSLKTKGGVYGVFIIDKNFSKDLLSIKSINPVKPIINFYQNPKKNYTATIVNKTVVRSIQESILDSVIKESSTTIKDKINNSDSKLNAAINGIKKLDDGMGTLKSSVDKALNSLNEKVKTLDIIRYQLENSNAAMAYKKLGIDLDTMQNSSDPKVQSLASRIKNDKPSMFAAMFGID